MRYPVFIEQDEGSDFGVTVPDLPGCFSAGATLDEALENSEEAVLTHIEGLLMDDDPIPVPTAIDRISHAKDFSDGIWAIVNCDLSLLSDDAIWGVVEIQSYCNNKADRLSNGDSGNKTVIG